MPNSSTGFRDFIRNPIQWKDSKFQRNAYSVQEMKHPLRDLVVTSAKATTITFRYSEQKYPCHEDENFLMRFDTQTMQIKHHIKSHQLKHPCYCFPCYNNGVMSRYENKHQLDNHLKEKHKQTDNQVDIF